MSLPLFRVTPAKAGVQSHKKMSWVFIPLDARAGGHDLVFVERSEN